jgi:nitric oxide reductase NorQ protein
MIAEMVAVGAQVKDAFINSLQVSRDLIESVLLSLHVELGLKETEPAKGYQVY